MSSSTSSVLLGATATGLVRAIMNPPLPHREYYTCQIQENNFAVCVKGRSVAPYSLWVPVCAYSNEKSHKASIAKKLGMPEEMIEMR